MKNQIELTLSIDEMELLKNALVSYQKELSTKKKKYQQTDTEKYCITESGKEQMITFCETTSRNIAFLYEELTDKTNGLFV